MILVKGHEYTSAWGVPGVLPKSVFVKLLEAAGFSDADAYTQDDVEDAHGTSGNRDNIPAEFTTGGLDKIPAANMWALAVWNGPDGIDSATLVGGVPQAGLLGLVDFSGSTGVGKGGGPKPTTTTKPKKTGTPPGQTRPKMLAFVGLGLATVGTVLGGWWFSKH